MKKYLFALCSLALLSQPTFASKEEAAFGLHWGMSADELRSKGVELKLSPAATDEVITTYHSKTAPKSPKIADIYAHYFYKGGLQKVKMLSTDFTDDPYGTEGKAAFNRIKATLTTKYGEPVHEDQTTGRKLWRDADEFYQCLEHRGCGMWFAVFKKSDVTVIMKITGNGPGKGWVSLAYEGPLWSDAVDEVANRERKAEQDAF